MAIEIIKSALVLLLFCAFGGCIVWAAFRRQKQIDWENDLLTRAADHVAAYRKRLEAKAAELEVQGDEP